MTMVNGGDAEIVIVAVVECALSSYFLLKGLGGELWTDNYAFLLPLG